MAGNMNVAWNHGAPGCPAGAEPPLQVHQFNEDTFILRQAKCSEPPASFEAPFMYLLFGEERALLLDTGTSRSAAVCPVGPTVRGLIARRLAERPGIRLPLVIAHTHGHTDHTLGGAQFAGNPGLRVVPTSIAGLAQFFGITNWPTQRGRLELGGRTLDVIPMPGHEPSHIVLYDRREKLLLTGDSLYPGLLVVNDWDAYRASVARLRAFASTREVRHILGAHVEMTNQPGRWFGLGVQFQPGEHVLQLTAGHLAELDDALRALGGNRRIDRHADFIIYPGGLPLPSLSP